MNYILDVAYEDMMSLQTNGIDSFMFGNEGDFQDAISESMNQMLKLSNLNYKLCLYFDFLLDA